MADSTGLQFTVKVGTLPESTLVVAEFALDEGVNRPFNLRLEDAGILAKGKPPQGRLHQQLVAGAAKTAVTLRHVAHHTAHPALQLAVVPHQQLTGLVQHGTEIDIRLLAGHLQVKVKGTIQAFIELEAGNRKGTVSQCANLDGEL